MKNPVTVDSEITGITPVDDRIIIRPTITDNRTESGIVVSIEDDHDQASQGIAVAVGPGMRKKKLIPLEVEPGQTVLYTRDSGNRVNIQGTDYVVVKEKDVIAVVD